MAAAPEQRVAPPEAQVPSWDKAKLVLNPHVERSPSLSTIHSCTAVSTLFTSPQRLEFLASANLPAGFKATKTTTASTAIIAITTNISIKVKPRVNFLISTHLLPFSLTLV